MPGVERDTFDELRALCEERGWKLNAHEGSWACRAVTVRTDGGVEVRKHFADSDNEAAAAILAVLTHAPGSAVRETPDVRGHLEWIADAEHAAHCEPFGWAREAHERARKALAALNTVSASPIPADGEALRTLLTSPRAIRAMAAALRAIHPSPDNLQVAHDTLATVAARLSSREQEGEDGR